MTTPRRLRPILNIDRRNTAAVIMRAHAVANGMAADPALFPAPTPALALVKAQIAKVDAGEQIVATRVKGAAALRDVDRNVLVGMLENERGYVQALCDAMPSQALAIIEAAGMVVAAPPVHDHPLLKVTPGPKSGTVDLDTHVAVLTAGSRRRVFFNWQWTTDGGATFHDAPSTPHGRTTLADLPPFTMVGFRVNVTYISGPGEWSPIVTVLVR